MSEVTTVSDLETNKKHLVFCNEVITGKSGGLASGAAIPTATNAVTGQVQKTLPKVIEDLGPQYFADWPGAGDPPVTLTNAGQALRYQLADGGDGHDYCWSGAFPKVVSAGSTPTPLGSGGWVDRSDVTLRSYINIVKRRVDCVASMVADDSLYVGDIVETVGYYNGWASTPENPRGGNTYQIVASGTGTNDGGSFIDLDNGLQAKALFTDGIVRGSQFGLVGDATTDNTAIANNWLKYCLTSKRNTYLESGHYKFTSLEFNAADYTAVVGGQYEKGIEICGENRVSAWLDGEIKFSAATPYVDYGTSRWSGLQFRNLMIYNTAADGSDALVLSGFGRISMYNVLCRAISGAGLSLLGGSELAAYGCQLQGSVINLKIRPQTETAETVDMSVVDFWNCDIGNTVAGGKTIDAIGYSGRFVNFHGGNIITTQASAYFSTMYVVFDCVNTENPGHPMYFDTCTIQAKGNQFALGSPKFSLTNSHFQDLGNLWSANETKNIQLEDEVSTVTLTEGRNYPTFFLSHTGLTAGQIRFFKPLQRFINDDFVKQHYYPLVASAAISIDTSLYKTRLASIYAATAGTYVTVPLKTSSISLENIAAIEYIATEERLSFVIGGVLTAANSVALVFAVQDFGDGFKRYVVIPRRLSDITQIRYTFTSSSQRFDSIKIHGQGIARDSILATAYPTSGTWSVGDVVVNSAPTAGGYSGWVCVTAGSPGTWKGYGAISA